MDADGRELFFLYLKDHLAAAVGGTELSKRAAKAEKVSRFGGPLQALSAEIEYDLHRLREVAEALGADSRAPVKERLAWFGEKLGRLKLNKRILERSPLSLVLELEFLQGAVMSKRAVWQTLWELRGEIPVLERYGIEEMLERADDQYHRIRELHQRAVHHAFTGGLAQTG